MDRITQIERSINKTYRKDIWKRFIAGINEYEMIKPGDKIAVCISGGKDSMLLAKCMQILQRHSDFPFEVKFLVMDPGYTPENRKKIEDNAEFLGVPINIFDAKIFDYVVDVDDNPCYLCARMRRGYLYKNAQALGCNKIALGHHFDDVIETVLLSMLYGAEVKTMMPKLHSTNYEGMELIRPLYYVREADILRWCEVNELKFLRCACRATHEQSETKRAEIKRLIEQLKAVNPQIEKNIFRSAQNVNTKNLFSYKDERGLHSFIDEFTEDEK